MTWDAVLEQIAKRLPPDLLERPAPWLSKKLSEESRVVTTFEAGQTVTYYANGSPPTVSPAPEPDYSDFGVGAFALSDPFSAGWIALLAYLGTLRGVVDGACFEGLRSHGYVAKVGR
jgi:hypothetical protein